MKVNIIGAGLAGCEAAYQLSKHNIKVDLFEMRPNKMTPAHNSGLFGELVCSNSFRSNQLTNAVGLLKEELRHLDSLIMKVADSCSVPAGSALAVDRDKFASKITQEIKQLPNVNIINQETISIPSGPTIIATGPLTSEGLFNSIKEFFDNDDGLYFYDAASPIVTTDSINFDKVYAKSRYEYGDDFLNCPFTKEEFNNFYQELINAETTPLHEFEKEIYFEGCLPIEIIAKRGFQTLTFGPMKPVGLEKDGYRPYAVVQLRKENLEGTLYNLVGFQTHLKWNEQKRVFSMIPGLENANFVRYGVMHRNTYINSPLFLNPTYQTKKREDLFIAGQFSGVEGYIESTGSGMVAAINMARYLQGKELIDFPKTTMLGAMAHYITEANPKNFQPMNANWGIFSSSINKKDPDKKTKDAKQALETIDIINKEIWMKY